MFKVYQYDVQVAFIQSVIDPSHPPVYCVSAEGYEVRRQYVYQFHKHLYGMKDSPCGWSKLVRSVGLKYGFAQLKSDECVFVKIVPNTKSGKSANTFSAILDTLPNVPERDSIYKDCPYESCIIILCSYVDDILVFTNCQSLALFNLLNKVTVDIGALCLQWLLARGALWERPVQHPWRELLCPHHVGRLGKRLCGEHVFRPFPGLPTRERESTRAHARARGERERERERETASLRALSTAPCTCSELRETLSGVTRLSYAR
jgi:hypothetical protein